LLPQNCAVLIPYMLIFQLLGNDKNDFS